jgi:hypothetical protein
MISSKALYAVAIILLIGAISSCRRSVSENMIDRLEASKAVEEEFRSAVRELYAADSKIPELATTLSSEGLTFNLTATNESDLDTVAPTIAKILKSHGVKSASLILLGTEMVLDGTKYTKEDGLFILGGYRIYADGTVENIEATGIIKNSIDASSDIPKVDQPESKKPNKPDMATPRKPSD